LHAALTEAFAESDLPWKVDVLDGCSVSPSFRQIIEAHKVLLQDGVGARVQNESAT
jgi:type I restriction enzyme S subunit